MVSKRPRKSNKPRGQVVREFEEDLRNNPPVLIWELIPNTGGLRVAVFVKDPQKPLGRRPRPPCECNLYGAPRRRHGPHHGETCGRRTP